MSEESSEEEYEKEAERLGWTVEYLKAQLRKEERIKKVFEGLFYTLRFFYNFLSKFCNPPFWKDVIFYRDSLYLIEFF
jgi:hypothetical protein